MTHSYPGAVLRRGKIMAVSEDLSDFFQRSAFSDVELLHLSLMLGPLLWHVSLLM